MAIKTNKDKKDTDDDGLSDSEEIVSLNYKYNADKTKVVVTGKLLSDPRKMDSDDDGIFDVDDPEPCKHFGTFRNNIDFKLTNDIKVPYNSEIEKCVFRLNGTASPR